METAKLTALSRVFQIAKSNLKHNSIYHIALSLVIILLTPVLFGTVNLDERASAVPLEMFVALIGIVLLTPIFQPEQNSETDDLTSSKYINKMTVLSIRTAYSVVAIIVLTVAFAFFMNINNCNVTGLMITGTIAQAIFLGSLGMISAAIFENTAVAYIIPVMYYAMNLMLGSKLKAFYLFSMMNGEYAPKLWLIISGVIMIFASLAIVYIKKKMR